MIKTIYVEAPNGGKTLLEGEINRRLREEGVKDEDIMNVSIGPYNNVTIFLIFY